LTLLISCQSGDDARTEKEDNPQDTAENTTETSSEPDIVQLYPKIIGGLTLGHDFQEQLELAQEVGFCDQELYDNCLFTLLSMKEGHAIFGYPNFEHFENIEDGRDELIGLNVTLHSSEFSPTGETEDWKDLSGYAINGEELAFVKEALTEEFGETSTQMPRIWKWKQGQVEVSLTYMPFTLFYVDVPEELYEEYEDIYYAYILYTYTEPVFQFYDLEYVAPEDRLLFDINQGL
jgi:hypothetical protein